MAENSIIDQLTPEQEAQIPLYIEKWKKIALSTERIDRQRATDAITAAYQWFDCEAPEIIFVNGLCEAFKEIDDTSPQYLMFCLLSDLRHPLLNHEYKSNPHHCTVIEQYLFDLVLDIRGKIYPYIQDCLWEENISLDENCLENSPNVDYLIPECCYYDFCISVLNHPYNQKQWQIFTDIIQSCGWVIAYENMCFVCERPTKLSFDDQNRLHASGEPAIEYADGFKVYSYHGTTLPEKYGEILATQWKSQWLLEETNAELRRVLIQGIGYERICQELGAVELDSWLEYTLLRIDKYTEINDEGYVAESMCLLKMVCPSTGHVHMLRVPPDMSSAREAVCWINWGVEPEDFAYQS